MQDGRIYVNETYIRERGAYRRGRIYVEEAYISSEVYLEEGYIEYIDSIYMPLRNLYIPLTTYTSDDIYASSTYIRPHLYIPLSHIHV